MSSLSRTLGGRLPGSVLRLLAARALAGLKAALCLHRVTLTRRPNEAQPALTLPIAELDALLELLVSARPEDERWLTVTFDDGYEDAAEYLRTRASKFPSVDFIFFICPEKTERGVGFRWDLVEQGKAAFAEIHKALDIRGENRRQELMLLSSLPEYRLASVEDCEELAALPNVTLGNHTNCHFQQTALVAADAQAEYETSLRDFGRLFGPQRHFAFPFGTPGKEFDASHVERLRELGRFLIWSTEPRPYGAAEVTPGAVLPRFPIDGTWTHKELVFWVAFRALRYRLRGSPHQFPAAVSAPSAS
jgi:hypothetical protein